MKTKLSVLAGLLVLSSVPAFADATCLRMDRIYNWDALDDKTLIVVDISHQKFKMSLMVPCINLTFKNVVAFKSVGGTELSCLERGDEVLTRDHAIPSRCPITTIVPYTAEMEKADKAAGVAKQQSVR